MIDARKVRSHVRVVRVAAYVALALVLGYGAWRYDVASLPSEGCSPLLLFEPGNSLVLDRRPVTVLVCVAAHSAPDCIR